MALVKKSKVGNTYLIGINYYYYYSITEGYRKDPSMKCRLVADALQRLSLAFTLKVLYIEPPMTNNNYY